MTERVEGLVFGTVSDTADPQGMGRVRVSYEAFPNDVPSQWAPIAAPMAGGGRGLYAAPEVGDTAIVAFVNGDVNVPVVLGFVWNPDEAPPADETTERVWKSVNGHSLTLSDGSDDGIVIEDSHGNSIRMDAEGVAIETRGKLTISVRSAAELEAGGSVTLKGATINLN
jgi:uncharacterized protein involved in type VI secretion and phage assembly